MIIGILGEKLAGKDTVAGYLVDHYGAVHLRTSSILDDLLGVLGLPVTRQNEIEAGRGMELVFGANIIGDAVKRRVQSTEADMVIINGMRQQNQIDNAKELGAKIIYITAPSEIRYQRFLQRREKKEDGTQSLQEFIDQEKGWTEVNTPAYGAQADFKIENVGTLEDLYKKVDQIISKLK